MHELSLAQGILNLVENHVPPRQMSAVQIVHVDLGRLSGVVADSLEFCFEALVAGTTLQNARLCLNKIPLCLSCDDCRQSFESDGDIFQCPRCKGNATKVVSGMELQVKEIELQEEIQEAT